MLIRYANHPQWVIFYPLPQPFLEGIKYKAWTGVEPVNNGFADRCLTTWLPRHIEITGQKEYQKPK
jgi:hypothetical protein